MGFHSTAVIAILVWFIGLGNPAHAAGKTPKLDVNRLFFTAAQRALIDSAFQARENPATPVESTAIDDEIVKVEPLPAVVVKSRKPVARSKPKLPRLNGYLLAREHSIAWLNGEAVAGGGQYASQAVQKTVVDDKVVFKLGAGSTSVPIPPVASPGGKLLLVVKP